MSLEAVLADEDWDYVSLQQASPFSGMYETYEASLPELIEYVKVRLPKKNKADAAPNLGVCVYF